MYYPKFFGFSNGDLIGLYETSERNLISHKGGSGVLRMSQNGNLKWKRRYYIEPWIPNSLIQLNLSWLDETEDGGLILSGYYEFYNQWKEIEHDVLLVKLDSMGCPYRNCNLADSIIVLKESITKVKNESLAELYHWSITNDHSELHVEFDQNIKKPDLLIIVYDIYGKEVNRQIVKSYQSSVYFNLSNLNQGLYCLSINAGKVIKGFKFIK